jgi:DNA adenine methylase
MTDKGRRLRSPIAWLGGKGRMVTKLLPLVPQHTIYVEPFGGGASMLLAREPSAVEVYNDLNSGLVNFFRVLRNKKQYEEFHRLASLTPFAREEHDLCKATWAEAKDPVQRAHRFFVVARMSFGGIFANTWGHTVYSSSRGMAGSVARYLSAVEHLPEVSTRLLRVQVEHGDAVAVIERYDTPETFFYLDPPYVLSTRKSGGYEHEMDDGAHLRLVELLLRVKGKVLLSGYPSPLYSKLERRGWQTRRWEAICSASGRTRVNGLLGTGAAKQKQQRVEAVWFNYEPEGQDMGLAP